ncbi:MAG: protein phosphatase 2C domain-containing protein [Lachnospiraceae bacterium]|nr:protein phosphatase 2C domain-containing protein [Lachnospiraceae bacterium]
MKFQIAYHSNIGKTKKVNQDAIGFKEIEFGGHCCAMMVVCDGMGGLQKGEMASATVVNNLLKWFEEVLPGIDDNFNYAMIQKELEVKINKCNKALHDYGQREGLQLGTTLSALIIRDDGLYLIANVGDSRVYLINRENAIQITEDQTFVAREIKNNRMSVEEAKESKYKNVLTQCIGVNEGVEVLFYRGKALVDELFIACSDGFRHFLSDIDLYNLFYDVCDSQDENEWDERLKRITEENMEKGEKDNISSILLKLSKQTL